MYVPKPLLEGLASSVPRLRCNSLTRKKLPRQRPGRCHPSRCPPQVIVAVAAGLLFGAVLKGSSYIHRRYFRTSSRGDTNGSESEDDVAGLQLCDECRAHRVGSSSRTSDINTTNGQENPRRGSRSNNEEKGLLDDTRVTEFDEDRSDRTVVLDWRNSSGVPRGSQGRFGSRSTERVLGAPRLEKLRDSSAATEEGGRTLPGRAKGSLSRPAINRSHSGTSRHSSRWDSLRSMDHKEEDDSALFLDSSSSTIQYPQGPLSPM